mmetsp:Transcript_106806/g.229946  ORF Transcript_106806/g.229946 Transcript_106806/m.229946 type:complete len:108 (-) Transcript_106806:16-339(-)
MALRAARGMMAAASRAGPVVARQPLARAPKAFGGLRQPAMAMTAGARPYVTVMKYDRDEVLDQLAEFHAEVLSTNWADYLALVYNVPFWEAELEKLTTVVQPYLHEK